MAEAKYIDPTTEAEVVIVAIDDPRLALRSKSQNDAWFEEAIGEPILIAVGRTASTDRLDTLACRFCLPAEALTHGVAR